MVGIVMQKFRRIHKLKWACARGGTPSLRKSGPSKVHCKPQGEPQHAL